MKLPYTRHTLRGTSDPTSVTASRAAAIAAYDRMRSARWTRQDEPGSDLPPHKYAQSGAKDTYDAYKFCGDYDGSAASASQRAYCGAVCYSFRIPADARSQATSLAGVSVPVYGDRWLADGSVLDLYLSDSPAPPAWGTAPDWTTGAPAPAGAESPAYPPPLQCVVRSNAGADNEATVSATFATPLPVGSSTAFLHLVLRLGDYTTVPKIAKNGAEVDSAWIEGGAAMRGPDVDLVFSRAVAPDTTAAALDMSPFLDYAASPEIDALTRELTSSVPGFLDFYALALAKTAGDADDIYRPSGEDGHAAPPDERAALYYLSAMRRLPQFDGTIRPHSVSYHHVMDRQDIVFGLGGAKKGTWAEFFGMYYLTLAIPVLCRSAWLAPRAYSRLVLGGALGGIFEGTPVRVVAYRLAPGQGFPLDTTGDVAKRTPNLHVPLREIMSDAVYSGSATSVPAYAKIQGYLYRDGNTMSISGAATAEAAVYQYASAPASIIPAGVVETAGEAPTEIPFPEPVALAGLTTFLLVFYPLPRASGFGFVSGALDSQLGVYAD